VRRCAALPGTPAAARGQRPAVLSLRQGPVPDDAGACVTKAGAGIITAIAEAERAQRTRSLQCRQTRMSTHHRIPPHPTPTPQAYAPAGSLDHRCLLIFGCAADGCGRRPGSWRAWRCQVESKAPVTPEPQQTAAPPTPPKTAAAPAFGGYDDGAGDAWGLRADAAAGGSSSAFDLAGGGAFDFGGAGAAEGPAAANNGGVFDFSDLTSAVERAATQLSAKPKAKAAAPASAAAAAGRAAAAAEAAVASCVGEVGVRLPEFHVYAEEEPEGEKGRGDWGLSALYSCNSVPECLQRYNAWS